MTDRWQPKEEPTQLDKLAESGKMVNSHTEYERRRNSRIEARKAEFDKLRREREKAEQDRLERIQRRRSERYVENWTKMTKFSKLSRVYRRTIYSEICYILLAFLKSLFQRVPEWFFRTDQRRREAFPWRRQGNINQEAFWAKKTAF